MKYHIICIVLKNKVKQQTLTSLQHTTLTTFDKLDKTLKNV